jgi:hypothetical protein
MLLPDSTIGELYLSLPSTDYKKLAKYIKSRHEGELSLSLRLHQILIGLIEKDLFKTTELEALKFKLFKDKAANHSRLTSQINILQTILKEFILLSKIAAKNIYTETLWGEYLIENKLKRNLLIKQSTYKLDVFKDEYPYQKEFYQKRENLFYLYFNSTKNNQATLYNSVINEIKAFENFELSKKLEQYIGLTSMFYNKKGFEFDLIEINKIIEAASKSIEIPIKINSIVLKLTMVDSFETYELLKKEFMAVSRLFSIESSLQIIGIILKFGLDKLNQGEETYSIENYNFYLFLEENEILYRSDFFNQLQMNRYITLCIKHASSTRARAILEEHIHKLPKAQIESCYNLNLAKIEFADKNYKVAMRLLYQINTNLMLFYLPLTKILLLKNLVEMEDYERIPIEKENFYKYYYASKTLPEDIKLQYTLYHKYIEHMLSVRYEFMSAYKRTKISLALQNDAPHFVEKEWMQGRWKRLQEEYGE